MFIKQKGNTMKTIYTALIVAIMIGFSGCDGASQENGALSRDNPTITLQGDKILNLRVGQRINDPGYSASDVKDGDLTSRVDVTTDLDFYKVGTYIVKYRVVDSDGFSATETRTVNITENGGLSGGNGAAPTITLQGDKNIVLAVGQQINEPGYTAIDTQDGDLTRNVQVTSDLDYYKVGTYTVNYSVTDSDGYIATASRIVSITQNGSSAGEYGNGYQYGDVDSVYYDFATYNYNYLVREDGKTVTQTVHEYDANGEHTKEIVFERNANDYSIYEYQNNRIERRDSIGINSIQSVDGFSSIEMKRNIRVNETFVEVSENAVNMSCKLIEHRGSINTQTVTGVNVIKADYVDVLHTQCTGTNGYVLDSYFANGWGEVLSISTFNGTTEYSVLDKNSMQTVN